MELAPPEHEAPVGQGHAQLADSLHQVQHQVQQPHDVEQESSSSEGEEEQDSQVSVCDPS